MARVDEIRAEAQRIMRDELATRAEAKLLLNLREVDARIDRQQKRWDMIHAEIEERFNDPELAKDHARVDVGLMEVARRLEEHAARELGQWQETGPQINMQVNLAVPAHSTAQDDASTPAPAPIAQLPAPKRS